MIILGLRANFGVLENRELKLQEGFNCVALPNESGKSTWCAFIQAMLYGIDTSAREKQGVKPDKLRYAPWSGTPMAGEMDLLWEGKAITLRRSTRTANAPMREFAAVYTGTEEPVPGLTGANAGETLTGVSRELFRRSAFVGQGALAVSGSPELEKRIGAIVSTGEDEGCSYTEADERLRSWQRKRFYNKKGSIPACEEALRQVEQQLARLEESGGDSRRAALRLEELERRRAELLPRLEQARSEERRSALQRLSHDKGLLRQAEQEDISAGVRLEEAERRAAESPFAGRDPGELRAQAAEDLRQCRDLSAAAAEKPSVLPWVLCLAAALLCAVLGAVLTQPFIFLPALALGVCAGVLAILWQKKRAAAQNAAQELHSILESYGAESPAALKETVEEYVRAAGECAARRQEKSRTAAALEQLRRQQQREDADLVRALDFQGGDSPAARMTRELARLDGEIAAAREARAQRTGQQEVLGDPVVLGSRKQALLEEHQRLTEQFEALSLAIETMREAGTELQNRFSPRLSRLAGQYFAALTGGKYAALRLDRKFRGTVQPEGEVTPREDAFLSAGALDQMYLALRLAVCTLALDDGGSCPLILDDALVNFDPERTGYALELLRELAQNRQVILFSCRELN